ncbi:MAG: LruC domain-containing protein [Leptospiraceae bacterium]|nr:LruC domain-containing protein [Leptospiraceae bacterium]
MKIKLTLVLILSLVLNSCSDQKKKKPIIVPAMNIIIANTDSGTTVSGSAQTTTPTTTVTAAAPQVTTTESNLTDLNFTYQSNRVITIDAEVVDQDGNPIPNALVDVLDPTTNSSIFSQLSTNPQGRVSGSLTVNNTDMSILVNVTVVGQTTQTITVPIRRTDSGANVRVVVTIIRIQLPITVPPTTTTVVDSDNDGVPDSKDDYPNDPTRATRVRTPSTGAYTIAFEDLYPATGDADLNDYVIRYFSEEDLNAKGEVVELRANYQHVARGAGYTHKLFLRLPSSVSVSSFTTTIYDGAGTNTNEGTTISNPNSSITNALPIYNTLSSNETLAGANNDNGQSYVKGKIAKIKILFSTPVLRSVIGTSPYDLYAWVNNTSREIHFPGKYKGTQFGAGKDDYVDPSTGFPWAILIPGDFKWPLESRSVISNNPLPYPNFNSWAQSEGVNFPDWYSTYDATQVYTQATGSDSVFLAYIGVNEITETQVTIAFVSFLVALGLIIALRIKKFNF